MLYWFLEKRGREGERERKQTSMWERNIKCAHWEPLTHTLGLCPHRDSLPRPLGLRNIQLSHMGYGPTHVFFLFKKKIFIFRREGRDREREGEKHQCVVASHALTPTRNLACDPGTYPDWELNQQPLIHRLSLNPLSHTNQGNTCFR